MITTLDGVIKKRGESVWEVGVELTTEVYRPTRSIVHSVSKPVCNPNSCWSNYDLCKTECDKLNNQLNE